MKYPMVALSILFAIPLYAGEPVMRPMTQRSALWNFEPGSLPANGNAKERAEALLSVHKGRLGYHDGELRSTSNPANPTQRFYEWIGDVHLLYSEVIVNTYEDGSSAVAAHHPPDGPVDGKQVAEAKAYRFTHEIEERARDTVLDELRKRSNGVIGSPADPWTATLAERGLTARSVIELEPVLFPGKGLYIEANYGGRTAIWLSEDGERIVDSPFLSFPSSGAAGTSHDKE